ncbi:MAG TPA: indole-3-glycerol phosphate synthase TrpC [Candidatus Eisenbacteria bacterium]|nr:indole-3-glycerol phosphate synthase TrpC [Candidatus Eisenbacteria bacterium]
MADAARADLLTRIASDRQRRVAEMERKTPGHKLRAQLGTALPAGRLERALRRAPGQPLRLICEIKRASPLKGMLNEHLDPVAMARLYEQGGATAISIVTEPDHFLGDPAWVNAVRPQVRLPILLKDFVLDTYQLLDAATRGADSVLMLAVLLSEVRLQRLITEARLLGLDALVEVHDEEELQRSLRAGATLVGINHRDLRTFEIDLETSSRLLPRVPPLVTAVAESGISSPEALARLRPTRCDAVLIGEAFMTSPDPAAVLASLTAAARG